MKQINPIGNTTPIIKLPSIIKLIKITPIAQFKVIKSPTFDFIIPYSNLGYTINLLKSSQNSFLFLP